VVKSGAIEITNPAGQVVLALPVPYIQDSAGLAGVREPNDTNDAYQLEQVDGRWKLTVSVDREWFNRKDIVYPVRVDPTLATPGYDQVWAIKSDGVVIQDGLARIGSVNDGYRLIRARGRKPGWWPWLIQGGGLGLSRL